VWPQYKDKVSGRAMILGDTQQPETRPNTAKLELYDQLYARQIKK